MRALALLLVVACGQAPPTDDRAARGAAAIAKLRTLADQICACPDAACRTRLHAGASTDPLDQTRLEAEQVEQLAKDQARLTACLARP